MNIKYLKTIFSGNKFYLMISYERCVPSSMAEERLRQSWTVGNKKFDSYTYLSIGFYRKLCEIFRKLSPQSSRLCLGLHHRRTSHSPTPTARARAGGRSASLFTSIGSGLCWLLYPSLFYRYSCSLSTRGSDLLCCPSLCP